MSDTNRKLAGSVPQLPLGIGGAGAAGFRRALGWDMRAWAPAVALVALYIGFSLAEARFADPANIRTLASQAAIPLILATGLTFIVLQGSIDLSIEGVMAACSLIFALLVANSRTGLHLGVIAIAASMLLGACFGAANGMVIVRLRVPSFMVTLGMWSVSSGVAMLISGGEPPQIKDMGLRAWALGDSLGAPHLAIVAAVFLAVGYGLQAYTRFGRYSYVIGGSEEIARLSGVAVDRFKIFAFVFGGLSAGLAAALEIGAPWTGPCRDRRQSDVSDAHRCRHRRHVSERRGRRRDPVRDRRSDPHGAFKRHDFHRRHAVSANSGARRHHPHRGDGRKPASAQTAEGGQMTAPPVSVEQVSKRYPGVQALDNVSLTIGAREVVGLIGENGSGKSTLLKALAGLVTPDEGRILLRGQPLAGGFGGAAKAGIGVVFQEQSLLLNITVAENILLGRERDAVAYGFYKWSRLKELARRQLDKLGCDIAPDAIAGSLSFAQRQMVELAKALAVEDQIGGDPVLLLDEPTSVLDSDDIDVVLAQIERLRSRASIVFVSHRLEEVLRVCDRVYVMTNGRCVAERDARKADPAELQALMFGQQLTEEYRRDGAARCPGEVRLSVRNLHRRASYYDISFEVRAGEIVGLAGVEGSGRESVCRAIYGAEPPTAGEVLVDGREVRFAGPAGAVALGIGYVPSERRVEGIVSGMSLKENMTLAHLGVVQRGPLLDRRRERGVVSQWMERLRIKAPSANALAGQLSGGNQQKVVLAKWLIAEKPRILILDHPLRGLDVGAKAEIFRRILELAERDIAVLLIADTVEELIALSDTILVMRDGRITARFLPGDPPPEPTAILEHMI